MYYVLCFILGGLIAGYTVPIFLDNYYPKIEAYYQKKYDDHQATRFIVEKAPEHTKYY